MNLGKYSGWFPIPCSKYFMDRKESIIYCTKEANIDFWGI